MIRTLKSYLAKDLAKATALAVVGLTLVMTVFAVIEPLRERGLSSHQALKLFGFSMPVMVSLTFPIAAMFAATVVYGRFAQDNELMACRASGICPISLLTPGVWLGVIVTLVTLGLGLYVAPHLLWRAQHSVKSDLRDIAFHRLRSKGYIEMAGQIFHADRVDTHTGWMAGVVALRPSDHDDAVYLAAAKAKLEFAERDGRTFVYFDPVNYVLRRQGGGAVAMMEREQIRRGELPNLFQDHPKLYNWTQLLQARSSPDDFPLVRQQRQRARRKLCVAMLYEDLVGTVGRRGKYARLEEFATRGEPARTGWIEIEAESSRLDEHKGVVFGSGGAAGRRAVIVRQGEPGRWTRRYAAREALVRAQWDEFYSANLITVTLRDVRIRELGGAAPAERGKSKEEIGPYAVPAGIRRESERAARLDSNVVQRLLAKVSAEIHLRLAYGASCLFMVMLGAALGLLFRGGQILAAFAISAVPASSVIVLLFMGKELIKNPGVPQVYGIAVIWGGFAALALATTYVYVVHMRR